jgi:hypothetical protein
MMNICSFSGTIADVKQINTRKYRESYTTFRFRQFKALASDLKVSVWDMSEGLYVPIQSWEREGYIKPVADSDFPWIRYTLTDKGQQVIEAGSFETDAAGG